MFQFLTHVELSRSMAAILEMPQYVAYQKNVAFAFMKLSAKSHSFNILCTMDVLAALLEEAEVAAQDRTVWRILTSQAACADNAWCWLVGR